MYIISNNKDKNDVKKFGVCELIYCCRNKKKSNQFSKFSLTGTDKNSNIENKFNYYFFKDD